MISALNEIEVITLFVEDLPKAIRFYKDVFGLETLYQDDVCEVMRLGSMAINVLKSANAQTLVEPTAVAGPGLGSRMIFTINVKDANAVCAELKAHGAALINGPMDRPWGRRTAAFADPDGNVWEIAQELPGS
jgi:lactoylglutathione lyase